MPRKPIPYKVRAEVLARRAGGRCEDCGERRPLELHHRTYQWALLTLLRGILRNRVSYVNEWECMEAMEAAVAAGINPDWLKGCALQCYSWNQFMKWVEDAIREATKDAK